MHPKKLVVLGTAGLIVIASLTGAALASSGGAKAHNPTTAVRKQVAVVGSTATIRLTPRRSGRTAAGVTTFRGRRPAIIGRTTVRGGGATAAGLCGGPRAEGSNCPAS